MKVRFPAGRVEPVGVQPRVDRRGVRLRAGVRGSPRRLPAYEVRVPALGAGPVAGRDGGGLVEEEQLGPAARPAQRPPPAPPIEPAGDPAPELPVADVLARGVVEHAAVAHQGAALGRRDDPPAGGDPIAQRSAHPAG